MDSTYLFAKRSARRHLPILVMLSDLFRRKVQYKRQWPVLFLLFIMKTTIYKVLSSKSQCECSIIYSVCGRYDYINLEVFFSKEEKGKKTNYTEYPFFREAGL